MTATPITKPDAAKRRERLIDIGRTLHGEMFGAKLAKGMGVSQQLVSFIVNGSRDVTDDVERKLLYHAVQVLEARKTDMIKTVRHIGSLSYELDELAVWKSGAKAPDPDVVAQELEPDDDPEPTITP